jgi:tetratricopeptide (TPR) repeat protein
LNPGDEQALAVLTLARSGDMRGAMAAGEAAIAAGSRDPGLTLFVGILCCRSGELRRGINYLRRATELAPGELAAKVELSRALISIGAYADARAVASPHMEASTPGGREMQRIVAHAVANEGRPDEAGALYLPLTVADAGDFESWFGLGSAYLATGNAAAAITPLSRATQLRPAMASHWIALARAKTATAAYDEAVAAGRRAVALAPLDPASHLSLGQALIGAQQSDEAIASLSRAIDAVGADVGMLVAIADTDMQCKAFERAESSYRAALALDPGFAPAILGLGALLERANRTAELSALLVEADRQGIAHSATALLRAHALRSSGDFDAALAAARSAPSDVDTVNRAQLVGEIADRLGDVDTAFEAFAEANAALAAEVGDVGRSQRYYAKIGRLTETLTPQWHSTWSPARSSGDRKAPLFVFGFPRSGTTLIDTMLIGHPATVVLEEEAIIHRTAGRLGSAAELRDLTTADIDRYRATYFGYVDRLAPAAAGRLVVDKDPLGLVSTPLLHRMFPDARYVFAQRHPCDVVLSCFMVSARFNLKLGQFFDLASTARLYDRVLGLWETCCAVLPLAVHTVRYERLIADTQTELRHLADFAGLDWDSRLMDHQSNAAARAFIGSPSYAQVAEPIYTRASGRWLRYRRQMEPVLPILAPWIEKMGYGFG